MEQQKWGVLVVISAFFVNLMNIGTLKAFGVLLPDLVTGLDSNEAVIGLAVGLSHGLSVGFAIVTNHLLKVVSVRKLVLLGGLMGGTGFTACAFVTNGEQFTALIVISALGYGLVTLPIRVTCVKYFPNHYFIATSTMLTGGGVGMMVIPPITLYLNDIYGWRGAVLILGGLNFQTMVTGAMLRPLSEQRRAERVSDNDEDEKAPLTPSSSADSRKELQGATPSGSNGAIVTIDQDGEEAYDDDTPPVDASSTDCLLAASTHNFGAQFPSTDEQSDAHVSSCLEKTFGMLEEGISLFWRELDFKVFVDFPVFSLVMVAVFFHGITYTGWIVFLVPNGVAKGYSEDTAVKLSPIGGASNIVGRLSIGFLLHYNRDVISPPGAFAFALVLSALGFAINPFANAFWVLILTAIMNGVSNGAKTVLVTIVSRFSVTPERFPTALSFAMSVRGFSEPLGGLLTGWIFDQTHSYNIAFVMLGGVEFIGALAVISAALYSKRLSESARSG
ncbi:monocarboxylate transporter 12-like [Diadema setosum]|uniref:monocarboxylate transporter 12-like n=1 Tax=Diadema setosum TaxID=31175 RepID=UPI003B3B7D87